ncbi:MAG: hypothetical protein V1925_05675 [Candidatus Omnitrophota bacterium]
MIKKMIGSMQKKFYKGHKVISSGRLHLDVYIEKEKDHYIAHCLDLDLVSQGATEEEAKQELVGLINEQIKYAVENNLEELLVHPAPPEYWKRFYRRKAEKLKRFLLCNPTISPEAIQRRMDVVEEAHA